MDSRLSGVYKVTFADSSESVKYWDGKEWESFGVSLTMTDIELGFIFIYPVLLDS